MSYDEDNPFLDWLSDLPQVIKDFVMSFLEEEPAEEPNQYLADVSTDWANMPFSIGPVGFAGKTLPVIGWGRSGPERDLTSSPNSDAEKIREENSWLDRIIRGFEDYLNDRAGYEGQPSWQRVVAAVQAFGWLSPVGLGPSYILGAFTTAQRAGYLGGFGGRANQFLERAEFYRMQALEKSGWLDVRGWAKPAEVGAMYHLDLARERYWLARQDYAPEKLFRQLLKSAAWTAAALGSWSTAFPWLGALGAGPYRAYSGMFGSIGEQFKVAAAAYPEIAAAYAQDRELTMERLAKSKTFWFLQAPSAEEILTRELGEWTLGQMMMMGTRTLFETVPSIPRVFPFGYPAFETIDSLYSLHIGQYYPKYLEANIIRPMSKTARLARSLIGMIPVSLIQMGGSIAIENFATLALREAYGLPISQYERSQMLGWGLIGTGAATLGFATAPLVANYLEISTTELLLGSGIEAATGPTGVALGTVSALAPILIGLDLFITFIDINQSLVAISKAKEGLVWKGEEPTAPRRGKGALGATPSFMGGQWVPAPTDTTPPFYEAVAPEQVNLVGGWHWAARTAFWNLYFGTEHIAHFQGFSWGPMSVPELPITGKVLVPMAQPETREVYRASFIKGTYIRHLMPSSATWARLDFWSRILTQADIARTTAWFQAAFATHFPYDVSGYQESRGRVTALSILWDYYRNIKKVTESTYDIFWSLFPGEPEEHDFRRTITFYPRTLYPELTFYPRTIDYEPARPPTWYTINWETDHFIDLTKLMPFATEGQRYNTYMMAMRAKEFAELGGDLFGGAYGSEFSRLPFGEKAAFLKRLWPSLMTAKLDFSMKGTEFHGWGAYGWPTYKEEMERQGYTWTWQAGGAWLSTPELREQGKQAEIDYLTGRLEAGALKSTRELFRLGSLLGLSVSGGLPSKGYYQGPNKPYLYKIGDTLVEIPYSKPLRGYESFKDIQEAYESSLRDIHKKKDLGQRLTGEEQGMLDLEERLQELKDIEARIKLKQNTKPQTSANHDTSYIGEHQFGFEGIVWRRTSMVVGEAGPERVTVTPMITSIHGGSMEDLSEIQKIRLVRALSPVIARRINFETDIGG